MRIEEFRSLVARIARDVPPEFRDGVVAIDVSPKTLPHPLRGDVYTLGECVPLEWSVGAADLHSRIILYYGSFASLARLDAPGEFDWRAEAWETLTHELRHHLEWRANVDALAAYDWAAEENFKRHEGEPFDPAFYRSGETVSPGIWKVDDDVFVEREGGRRTRDELDMVWHGRRYRVTIPLAAPGTPRFLILEGLVDPPPGDAVLVMKAPSRIVDLFRRRRPPARETVQAMPLDG